MSEVKTCLRCGLKYTPKRKNNIQGCTKVCRYQIRNGKRKCLNCSKEFWPTNNKSSCCSRVCVGKLSQSPNAQNKREQTNMKKYGVKNVLESEEIKSKIKQTSIDRYGEIHPSQTPEAQEKRKKTNIEKYGVENVFQSKEIIDRIKKDSIEKHGVASPSQTAKAQEKRKQTNLEKYGAIVPTQNKDIIKKIQQTNLEKYGVTCTIHNENVKKKVEKTMLERYGAKTPFSSEIIQEKIKQTNLEKYGAPNPFGSEKIKEKIKKTNLKKYNVDNPSKSKQLQELYGKSFVEDNVFINVVKNWSKINKRKPSLQDLSNHFKYANPCNIGFKIEKFNLTMYINKKDSYLELLIKDFLDENNIIYKRKDKTQIKPLELDFYLPDFNIAIEVNDFLTHNSTYNPWGEPKDKNYHYNKTILCREKNIRLIHAWEHYIKDEVKFEILKNVILHACGLSEYKIYARNTRIEVRSAIIMKEFFNKNHIAGYRGARAAYVLVDNKTNEDVMCYLVGYSHFGKGKYDAEIIRGASKLGYSVIGGASKLWSYIIKNTDYNSIVYYVDLNLYNGCGIKYLNDIKFLSENISYKNYFHKTNDLKSRNPTTHKEISNLKNLGEVWQIYDAGTQVNVWNRCEDVQKQV